MAITTENPALDPVGQALIAIARAAESRDPHTGDHCERLARACADFGAYLHLSAEEVQNLVWGGYLHDIGKVGIPDTVLLKPAKLTVEEHQIMEQHVLIGEQICTPISALSGVLPIIRHHHERWNGTGYPDKLKESAIPLLAQVFQLADIYDALTHARPYKVALSSRQALNIMNAESAQGWRNPKLMAEFQAFIGTIVPV